MGTPGKFTLKHAAIVDAEGRARRGAACEIGGSAIAIRSNRDSPLRRAAGPRPDSLADRLQPLLPIPGAWPKVNRSSSNGFPREIPRAAVGTRRHPPPRGRAAVPLGTGPFTSDARHAARVAVEDDVNARVVMRSGIPARCSRRIASLLGRASMRIVTVQASAVSENILKIPVVGGNGGDGRGGGGAKADGGSLGLAVGASVGVHAVPRDRANRPPTRRNRVVGVGDVHAVAREVASAGGFAQHGVPPRLHPSDGLLAGLGGGGTLGG